MNNSVHRLEDILNKKSSAIFNVQTLGGFNLWRSSEKVTPKDWGRDAAIQLFQFFITNRHRHALHKEQIIDRLWGDLEYKAGQQNFKVAHHGLSKVLEPERKSREDSKYILRQGASYQLLFENFWIDVEIVDQLVALGNEYVLINPRMAEKAYKESVVLYDGMFLPDRLYSDWSTEERERIQILILGAIISLSEILLKENPMESIRLTQMALQIDHTWEDAYRIQMEAYMLNGNRPMAIKTFRLCEKVLEEEFGLSPLPGTKKLYSDIQ